MIQLSKGFSVSDMAPEPVEYGVSVGHILLDNKKIIAAIIVLALSDNGIKGAMVNTSPNCMCVFSSNRAGELKVLTHNENVYCLNNSEEKSRLYTHSLVTGVINGELYQGEYNEPVDFHVDQSCSNYHVGAVQVINDTCCDTRNR